MGEKPGADDIAAYDSKRKQGIDRLTDESQANKDVRSGPAPREQKPPADAAPGQRRGAGKDNKRRAPFRASTACMTDAKPK
jgi:hypothetical protein